MGSFRQYLTESRFEKMSEEEALQMVRTKCSKIVRYYNKNGWYITRGRGIKQNYSFADTSKFEDRTSKNVVNIYTLIMNNTPEWKKFPKRNLICSTSPGYARGFGNVYVVFPYNGTKIGICGGEDIWSTWSFPRIGRMLDINNISDLVYVTGELFKKIVGRKIEEKNFSKFVKDLHELSKMMKENPEDIQKYTRGVHPSCIRIAKKVFEKYDGDMFGMLKYLMDPKANKFTIKTSGKKLPEGREVWMDGKVVMVSASYPNDLITDFMEKL